MPPWGRPSEPTVQLVKLHGTGDLQRFLELLQAALVKKAWLANPSAGAAVPSHPVADVSPAPSGELPGISWMGQRAGSGGPLGAGAASWSTAGTSQAAPAVPPTHLLSQLTAMGYGENRATRALQATGTSGGIPWNTLRSDAASCLSTPCMGLHLSVCCNLHEYQSMSELYLIAPGWHLVIQAVITKVYDQQYIVT